MLTTHMELEAIIDHSVGHTLETMCYSEVQPVSDNVKVDRPLRMKVGFEGTLTGELQLEVAESAAASLSVAFAGLRELPPNSTYPSELTRELSNVICGRMISLLDPCADIRILPVVDAKSGTLSGRGADNTMKLRSFQCDAGLLRVTVRFDSRVLD